MGPVVVTDYHMGEQLAHYQLSSRAVVLRLTPATCPLETTCAEPLDVLRWLRAPGLPHREWHGWCRWEQRRNRVRLLAAQLPPPAADWPLVDVLRRYRARWQVELVCKRMKHLLRLNQGRRTHCISVEATVRALLVAWALQDGVRVELRTLLAPGALTASTPTSSWLLMGLRLDTLRQQVQGTWSQVWLRACLPRLRRLLMLSPRRWAHQETVVRAWLAGRDVVRPSRQQDAA